MTVLLTCALTWINSILFFWYFYFPPFFLLSLYLYISGMAEVVKIRPENPIEFLASYLLRNDPSKVGNPPAAAGQHN
jgi:hypothetical protein